MGDEATKDAGWLLEAFAADTAALPILSERAEGQLALRLESYRLLPALRRRDSAQRILGGAQVECEG